MGGLPKRAGALKVTGWTWSLRIVLPSVAILLKKEISDLDLRIAEHIVYLGRVMASMALFTFELVI